MPLPSVTIVFVVFNRRDELRESLRRMLFESDYEGDVDVIVVDNASSDGSAGMVREEFPQVRLIEQPENIGAPAWNDGYMQATGDWVVTLDDDAYLPPDGLRRAIEAASEYDADLVSFKVASTYEPEYVFTDKYRPGLLAFWGCTWIVKRDVLQELGGYDPEIFMWANEMELMIRFLDRGYRHLYFPGVVGWHMKAPPRLGPGEVVNYRPYRINARNWAYIAGKLLRPRDAGGALIARLAQVARDAIREQQPARALTDTVAGFVHGLRHRRPVRAEVSAFYRRNCETFVSPWSKSRTLGELLRELPGELARGHVRTHQRPVVGRWQEFFSSRPDVYPENEPGVLSL